MANEIPVLFKDEHLIVVEKPTGISIHNSEDSTNLMVVLRRQLPADENRLFPIHRLDKETSGVQIFARTEEAASRYAVEFQTRQVRKVYRGVLRGSMKTEAGVWVQPLSDKSEGRVNPAGLAGDRVPCETQFTVIKSSKFFTLCDFNLITGRQHQIRKHAAIAGHALVGDARYGDKKYNARVTEMYGEDRMFLHCAELELHGQIFQSESPTEFSKLL
jgi:RluA family pseudouridine synthase